MVQLALNGLDYFELLSVCVRTQGGGPMMSYRAKRIDTDERL